MALTGAEMNYRESTFRATPLFWLFCRTVLQQHILWRHWIWEDDRLRLVR